LTFIYFSPVLCFILEYNCGLTVRNKRICNVMLIVIYYVITIFRLMHVN